MAGLADYLLDPLGRLRQGTGFMNNPPRPPGDVPPLGRYLVQGRSTQHVTGLSDPMQQRLLSFFSSAPPEIQAGMQIGSGYRTTEHQQMLWDRAVQKYGSPAAARKWVAPPGSSQHNLKNAADLHYTTPEAKRWAHENAPRHGLKFPLKNEDWHIEVSETRGGPAFTGQLNTQTAGGGATRVSSAPPPPSGQVSRLRGASIGSDFVMNKLQTLGFNEAQSKVLVGNMVAESSLRPGNINPKEGAYGLMQWRGQRFENLQAYAKQQGKGWQDPNVQLEYLAHEMRNDPYENRQAQRFLNATTVEDANAGIKSYIRYGDNSEGKRLAYAQAVPTQAGNVAAATINGSPAVQAINAAVKDPAPATASAPGLPASVSSMFPQMQQNAAFPADAENTLPTLEVTAPRLTPQSAPRPQAAQAPAPAASAPASSPARLTGRSKLAQGIIDGYGPAGANLSTFVEPATGNEIISGSIGGDSYWKNLGRTGAGQPAPQQAPASLKQAVEQAVATPMPRPRPPEAPRDLGQRFRPMPDEVPSEVTHRGVRPGQDENVSIFTPKPDYRLTTGQAPPEVQAPNLPGPQGTMPFKPAPPVAGSPFNTAAPSFPGPRGSPAASGLPVLPPSLPPLSPPPAAPSIPGVSGPGSPFPGPGGVVPPAQAAPALQPQAQVPFLQWWQQPGGIGGYAGGAGFGMPGTSFAGGLGGGGFPLFGGFGSGGGGVG